MSSKRLLKYVRRWRGVVILSAALLGLGAAPAVGATVTEAPRVSGDPTPGSELSASSGGWTPAGAAASYDWLRCDASGAGCTPVRGACDRRYTVRDADLGHRLRVRLTVAQAGEPRVSASSGPTAVVVDKPYSIPTPGDSGRDCVEVTATGPGRGSFTSGSPAGPGTTPAPDTALAFIDPFPVVRISGRFRARRTTLTRVTVDAPHGSRIRIGCTGRGCPYRRKAAIVRLLSVRSLQRTYRPKATIEIRVTQSRKIGKYTRLKTRRGKAPLRLDRCLMPGKSKPVTCPTT